MILFCFTYETIFQFAVLKNQLNVQIFLLQTVDLSYGALEQFIKATLQILELIVEV